MQIKCLGSFSAHPFHSEWLISCPTPVPYFSNLPLIFTLENYLSDHNPEEFDITIQNFLSKKSVEKKTTEKIIFQKYQEFIEQWKERESPRKINTPAEVWKYMDIQGIGVIRQLQGEKKVYIQASTLCDWEREHYLQLIFMEGKLLTRAIACDAQTPKKACRNGCGMFSCYNG